MIVILAIPGAPVTPDNQATRPASPRPAASVHDRRVETGQFLGLPMSTIRRLRHGKEPVGPVHFEHLDLHHSHGGTGCGSAYNHFLASRASFSNPSSTVFAGAYFRYHQHQPSLTSV